ncbi:hypothetical protein D0T56_11495 [Dysgonomonas sp. 520]|nr:hypothetical protein [Dysgonomonas sp. 520]
MLLVGFKAYGQVGINTETPGATMHITPTKTDGTTAEGIIAPNLTRAQLIGKDAQYSTAQRGSIVYVTSLTGTTTTKTAKVTSVGYYYFDGSLWQPFISSLPASTEPWYVQGSTTQATSNTQNIFQTGNVAIGSNTSSSYKFQVTGTSNITGNARMASLAKIGSGTTFNSSAQLELSDANKGLLLNRVALTAANVKAPVTNAVAGMMVYNTTSNANVTPGVYYWNGVNWIRMVTEVPNSELNLRDLQVACTSLPNDANNTNKGALMNMETLIIPEDGSYAFSFRLYGSYIKVTGGTGNTGIYYIAMLANEKLVDTAEMDIIHGAVSAMTYSVTLGAKLAAGDVITFRLSHHPVNGSLYPWNLNARPGAATGANRTSMIWWKL